MFALPVNACAIFNPNFCSTFNDTILKFVLPTMQAIVIGLAIIYLLIGAIQYIMSAGEEKATKTATATLTNAAIGMAIALLVVLIIQVLKQVLGASSGVQTAPTNLIPGSGSSTSGTAGP